MERGWHTSPDHRPSGSAGLGNSTRSVHCRHRAPPDSAPVHHHSPGAAACYLAAPQAKLSLEAAEQTLAPSIRLRLAHHWLPGPPIGHLQLPDAALEEEELAIHRLPGFWRSHGLAEEHRGSRAPGPLHPGQDTLPGPTLVTAGPLLHRTATAGICKQSCGAHLHPWDSHRTPALSPANGSAGPGNRYCGPVP